MTSSNQLNENLEQIVVGFAEKYISHYQQVHKCLPFIEKDEDWPSPCEQGIKNEKTTDITEVNWQPVAIDKDEELSFENVESALELTLHKDIKSYFTSLYSESLDALCDEGGLSLLFAWNKKDFERLQENLIGHILMKRRLKQQETIFFAVTDEEDIIISLDNATGEIWVERVGCKPHKKLSNSLAQFISQLTPVVN